MCSAFYLYLVRFLLCSGPVLDSGIPSWGLVSPEFHVWIQSSLNLLSGTDPWGVSVRKTFFFLRKILDCWISFPGCCCKYWRKLWLQSTSFPLNHSLHLWIVHLQTAKGKSCVELSTHLQREAHAVFKCSPLFPSNCSYLSNLPRLPCFTGMLRFLSISNWHNPRCGAFHRVL